MSGGLDLGLTASARDVLLGAGCPRAYRAGEVVFHQGDPSDALYLLRVGRAAVRVTTPDGDVVTLGLLCAPEEFGEVSLLREDRHHTASVVALEDVRVLTVPAARFHELRAVHPELTEWLLHSVVRHLERTSTLLSEALFLDADSRVARRLLDAYRQLAPAEGACVPLTQDDVAAMAGVSRPTANRALRRLETRGIVGLGRRHIDIREPEALAAAAG